MRTALMLVLVLAACGNDAAKREAQELETEVSGLKRDEIALESKLQSLSGERDAIAANVASLKQDEAVLRAEKDGRGVHYVLHVSIRQISYSFSLTKQLRDAVNEEEFDLPTDKVTYEHANVGDDLFDSFRAGSAIFRGSLGSWRLKVVGKKAVTD